MPKKKLARLKKKYSLLEVHKLLGLENECKQTKSRSEHKKKESGNIRK